MCVCVFLFVLSLSCSCFVCFVLFVFIVLCLGTGDDARISVEEGRLRSGGRTVGLDHLPQRKAIERHEVCDAR